MTADQIAMSIVTVVISTVGAAVASTIAHKIHIMWIREALDRHEKAINRAHARIDEVRESR